ncbi:MAG: hypothetical protein IT289_10440 [Oligoflexia bacterium]|nr:hypothetical protein [Oligoflexia bacterium]
MLKIFSLSILLLATGCVGNPIEDPPIKEPESRIYFDSYEQVWRAVQLALRKYPVRINNIDLGVLETDYIKGDKLFSDPKDGRPRPGLKYKINMRVVRGRVEGRAAVNVTVLKTSEIQPDFFSSTQQIPSDGLEERALLYRIGRFLDIDRMLTKAQGAR